MSKVFDKYFNEKEDVKTYDQEYPMNNINNIVMSLNKIFNKYNISYKPRKNSYKVKLNYLLNKLEKIKISIIIYLNILMIIYEIVKN